MDALLVWGLLVRGLALTYAIFFLSLLPQIAGLNRIYPIEELLARVRADLAAPGRYLYFPTLSWLFPGTRGLQLMAGTGLICSLLTMFGGAWSWVWLLLCWLLALSLVNSMGEFVGFVWDRLLLEAGFLALFLPALKLAPSLQAQCQPIWLLRLAFALLLFRVMFGMGKFKFLGKWRKQPLYLKWFYSFQPLPTTLAYFAFRLPGSVHKGLLYGMYVVEMYLPFLLFTKLAVWAAVPIICLQIGIWLSGNFGIFNLLTAVLCLPSLAGTSTVPSGCPHSLVLSTTMISVAIVGGLIYFPHNTWVTNVWLYSLGYQESFWLRWSKLVDLYRLLSPFHIANAYGIFEAQERRGEDLPSLQYRRVLVIEGSLDGREWREYVTKFQTCRPENPPRHFAPHQPRIDHNLYYEAFSVRFSNINMQNPYYCGQFTWLDRLIQRLLEGDDDVLSLFANNPFPDSPPLQVRVKRYNVRFTTAHERADTGDWFVREFYELKLGPTALNSRVFQLPEPRQFVAHHSWWNQRFDGPSQEKPDWDYEEIVEYAPAGRLNLGGRHFVLFQGVWYDALFQPHMAVLEVKRMSRAHRRLLRLFPDLRECVRLPKSVVVVAGRAVAFTAEGLIELDKAELEAFSE